VAQIRQNHLVQQTGHANKVSSFSAVPREPVVEGAFGFVLLRPTLMGVQAAARDWRNSMRCFLILGAFLVTGLVGCDGHTSVRGRVVDSEGKAIPEAKVKLVQQTDHAGVSTARTDEDGEFDVGVTHAPRKDMPFLFEISKEGYEKHTEKLTGTASYQKEITLQRVRK
jgi:hypothetical protein